MASARDLSSSRSAAVTGAWVKVRLAIGTPQLSAYRRRAVLRSIPRGCVLPRAVVYHARDHSPVCCLRPVRDRRHTRRRDHRSPPGSPLAPSPHRTSGHRAPEDFLGHDRGIYRGRSAKKSTWAGGVASLLALAEVRAHLDFGRAEAIGPLAVVPFVADADDPEGAVACLRDAVASGNCLAISHIGVDFFPARRPWPRRMRCMRGPASRSGRGAGTRSSASSTVSSCSSLA